MKVTGVGFTEMREYYLTHKGEVMSTFEELKYEVKESIKEITEVLRLLQQDVNSDYIYGEVAALGNALDILKKHVSEYLEE